MTCKQTHSLTEKELPQEQPWSAWGFFNTWKVERISSWVKSTVDPLTNSRLSWSTRTPTPPCSNTLRAEQLWDTMEHIWLSTSGGLKTTTTKQQGSLPVVFLLARNNRELVLEARAAPSLHVYSQVLALLHDFWQPLESTGIITMMDESSHESNASVLHGKAVNVIPIRTRCQHPRDKTTTPHGEM